MEVKLKLHTGLLDVVLEALGDIGVPLEPAALSLLELGQLEGGLEVVAMLLESDESLEASPWPTLDCHSTGGCPLHLDGMLESHSS